MRRIARVLVGCGAIAVGIVVWTLACCLFLLIEWAWPQVPIDDAIGADHARLQFGRWRA